jgi:CRP/FNR family transcriptional regulator, cyclic AMP receptor protein
MKSDTDTRALVEAALARSRNAEGEELFDTVLRYGRRAETREGKAFFYQGDKAESAHLLLEGTVRPVKYKASGKPIELPPLAAGDWLGLPELASGVAHPYDALADESCSSIAFSRYGYALASLVPAFAAMVTGALARELLALYAFTEDESPEERIIAFLLSRKRELAGIGTTRVSVTQERLAQAIGVSRETVNKRLKILEHQGLLKTLRGEIEVLDWKVLAMRRNEG